MDSGGYEYWFGRVHLMEYSDHSQRSTLMTCMIVHIMNNKAYHYNFLNVAAKGRFDIT